MKKTIILFFTLLVFGCEHRDENYVGLNSTLWMQSSAEYVASVEQAWNVARAHLDEAISDKNWTAALEQRGAFQRMPAAVIFDVDETVLDNSPYEAHLISIGQRFSPETWSVWANAARAKPITGAKELIAAIKARGVAVFYVTNRNAELEDATVKNIKMVLDPDVQADRVLCKDERDGWGSDKSSRRAAIAETHRIIMMFGDDYNDFRSLKNSPSPEARIAEVQSDKGYFGSRWIMLSNPRYGHWERAIFNYANGLPDDEKLQIKFQYLKADSGMSQNS